jgi:hypothetical protein
MGEVQKECLLLPVVAVPGVLAVEVAGTHHTRQIDHMAKQTVAVVGSQLGRTRSWSAHTGLPGFVLGLAVLPAMEQLGHMATEHCELG